MLNTLRELAMIEMHAIQYCYLFRSNKGDAILRLEANLAFEDVSVATMLGIP